MVTTEHVSASLRLASNMDGTVKNIRTFSGVRPDIDATNVSNLISGVNSLRLEPATSAFHTARTEIKLSN